jgi:predicted CXXCH cytochrome family protein
MSSAEQGRSSLAPASQVPLRRLMLFLFVSVLPLAAQAVSIEHPGILHKTDDCSHCHLDKTRGKSVHSAMALPCTLCHEAETQGDMTTLRLFMPKETICFACHDRSMLLRQHSSAHKGLCSDCHDAHSSNRRMLLRSPRPEVLGNRR